MAVRYAVATGNWSDTATWNGGTLPTSSDDVYSNTYTVTIDQDVTVLSLRNGSNASPSVTAGGGFTCSTARTITATGLGINVAINNGTCLTLSNASETTVTVNAAIGGSGNQAQGVLINSTGTVNITGNLSGIASSTGGATCRVTRAATVNVTGSVTAGSAGANGIDCQAAATITVIGSVTGGSSNGGIGVNSSGSSVISITGNVIGGPSGSAPNYGVSATGSVNIVGTLTAGAWAATAGAGSFVVTGPFISSAAGQVPMVNSGTVKLSPITANEFRFAKNGGGTSSLWSSDVNSGAPTVGNVRKGTTYGVSNEFTGTLAVPPAASVAYGVPVDNTTGTAALSPADIAALVGAQIAAALDSAP